MACTTKSDLIDATVKDFAKLSKLIAALDEGQASLSDDGASIKDVIGHRAHWIDLFLGWYRDGMAGETVYFPAKGYRWNDLKRYNAELRRKQAHLDWADVCSLLQDRHDALVHLLSEKSNDALYSGPMQGANNKWTVGRWAEAAGPSHYRSAAKFIRAVLRKNSQGQN